MGDLAVSGSASSLVSGEPERVPRLFVSLMAEGLIEPRQLERELYDHGALVRERFGTLADAEFERYL